jgi:heme/copper-type cytochrome/quinol oxidase subunit 2
LTEPNQDVTLRNAVLHAWARSIATVWIVITVFAGVALILTLFLREYSVDRKTARSGDVKVAGDREGNTSMGEGSKESGDKTV